MKTIPTLALLGLASLAIAQDEPAGPTLKPGGDVPLEPVTKATWIQGSAPEKWEEGKVYVFECWATWCGPCIAAIPHVNGLHKKYAEKGLRICGMNVWEDGEDKVREFVKQKGDGMSYPIAYTGKGSDFEKQWLQAAGVRGIPHAFVVKGGKYLFGTHPMNLSEKTIEALLAGGEEETQAVESIRKAAENREALGNLARKFGAAAAQKDAESMADAIAKIKEIDPESRYLGPMALDLAIVKKDWKDASARLKEMAKSAEGAMSIGSVAYRATTGEEDMPVEFRQTVADAFAKVLETEAARPTGFVILAGLRQSLNDLEGAKAAAKMAVENPGNIPVEPLKRYAKALDDGESPSVNEVFSWLREAMSKAREN